MFSIRLVRYATSGLTNFALWVNSVGITVIRLLASGSPQHYVAAVGTAWSLLGSLRKGQAKLYLNHLLFRDYIDSISHCDLYSNS
jgi:hypothetical protein